MPNSRRKRGEFKGKLVEPIDIDLAAEIRDAKIPEGAADAEVEAVVADIAMKIIARVEARRLMKFGALFAHYGIDRINKQHRWYVLSRALAHQFVPGFLVRFHGPVNPIEIWSRRYGPIPPYSRTGLDWRPALSARQGRGRPAKWGGKSAGGPSSQMIRLIQAVERIRMQRGGGVSDAVRILQKRHPDEWGAAKTKTLINRYHEGLRKFGEVILGR